MKTLPKYKIKRIKQPVLTRWLGPSHFTHAQKALLKEAITGKKAAQETRVQMLWDRRSLYAFFDMEERRPDARLRKHDSALYTENVVELFLDPLGMGKVYYELEINPLNTAFDALIINDIKYSGKRGHRCQGFLDWNPKSFKHKSVVCKNKWQVFLKIDFCDLFLAENVPPKPGDVWRGNILRIDRIGRRRRLCAWGVPGVPDFHNAKRFGYLLFI